MINKTSLCNIISNILKINVNTLSILSGTVMHSVHVNNFYINMDICFYKNKDNKLQGYCILSSNIAMLFQYYIYKDYIYIIYTPKSKKMPKKISLKDNIIPYYHNNKRNKISFCYKYNYKIIENNICAKTYYYNNKIIKISKNFGYSKFIIYFFNYILYTKKFLFNINNNYSYKIYKFFSKIIYLFYFE